MQGPEAVARLTMCHPDAILNSMSTTETKQKGALRHLGPIVRKYWVRYLVGLLILGVVDVSQTIIPNITAGVIDSLSAFTATSHTLLVALLQIAGLIAAITVGRYFWRFLIVGHARLSSRRCAATSSPSTWPFRPTSMTSTRRVTSWRL